MILRIFFSRKRVRTTLLAFVAVAVMLGLGVWQLDRLQQRRAFNARVSGHVTAPSLELSGAALETDLTNVEYRAVHVVGKYDEAHQVALRNQAYKNQVGVTLLTPLIISGTQQAVLVNRGWIPFDDAAPDKWSRYAEPGIAQVRGVIRRAQTQPDFGGINDSPGAHQVWNLANVSRIAEQLPYPLLPIYIQQTPNGSATILADTSMSLVNIPGQTAPIASAVPQRMPVELDLSEGSHLPYALQWFLFAAIVAIGYPRIVLRRDRPNNQSQV
ncbi:MAG: SURF1 family protein [Chloroflexi bacterium]|nr:SURF1 family protein [Chloroflexota bacterium]